jgi:hypothetical protein
MVERPPVDVPLLLLHHPIRPTIYRLPRQHLNPRLGHLPILPQPALRDCSYGVGFLHLHWVLGPDEHHSLEYDKCNEENTNGEGASLNMIALGAKLEDKSEINRSLYQVQVWLGLAMSIVWGMIMIFKVRQEKQLQIEEDFKNPSASDFTVMIEDMPKRIGIDDFEAIINLYTNTVK